jgi:alpha-beta hydrolase superfamily lysophospholipase
MPSSFRDLYATVAIPGLSDAFALTGIQRSDLLPGEAGRVFVYVAGLGGCFEWARPFWEETMAEGICDTVIGIDLPSFGVNRGVACSTIYDCIAALKHLVVPGTLGRVLGLEQDASWVWSAISLGAMCTAHVFVPYQDNYAGLCLFVPAFLGNKRTYHPAYILKTMYTRLTAPPDAPLTLPYGITSITRNTAVHESHGESPIQHPVHFMLSIMKPQMGTEYFTRRVYQPTLIVTAGTDKVCCTTAMKRAFRRLQPNARHLQAHFPHMYHDVLLEPDRELVRDALHQWVRGL